MMTLPRRVAHVLSMCAAFVLGSAPVMAVPAAFEPGPGMVEASPTPQGVKSRTVAGAVVLVAKGIRKGNKHFGNIIKNLKGPAGAAFLQNSEKIADVLDDIAKIPDVVLRVVGQRLFHLLSDKNGAFKIEPGLAKDITEEIVGVISALL